MCVYIYTYICIYLYILCCHGQANFSWFVYVSADVVLTNDVTANQVSLSIFNLETYTSYTIEVAAFTVKGLGPKSRAHIWTKEASMSYLFFRIWDLGCE